MPNAILCKILVATALFTLPGLITPAVAHHSFSAEFDINKPIQLSGEVIRLVFSNPHSYIYLKVTRPQAKSRSGPSKAARPTR